MSALDKAPNVDKPKICLPCQFNTGRKCDSMSIL